MTERALFVLLVAESGLVLAGVLTLAVYVAARAGRARRHGPPLKQARSALVGVVMGQTSPDSAAHVLRGLPLHLTVTVVHELARTFTGEARERLRAVTDLVGVVPAAVRMCDERRWWRRVRGLRLLAELPSDTKVPAALLDDAHPVVRAAAIAALAPDPGPRTAARLLQLLDDPDPLCRFSAKSALVRAGSAAAQPLRSYLATPPVARPAEALEVAATVADPSFLAAALQLSTAKNPLTRRAAAGLLSRIGGQDAIWRIQEMLEDPVPGVRAEAARGLGDLCHWPASPALAAAMCDPSWDVRSASAFALRRVGAPGLIYLRQAQCSPDPFCADIAGQVLALPEGATVTMSA